MKELRLIVRVKNNILLKYREQHTLTQNQMAKLCGIATQQYQELENLKSYPLAHGKWNRPAEMVSLALDIPCEVLFPEAFQQIKETKIEREVDAVTLLAEVKKAEIAFEPIKRLEDKETKQSIEDAVSTLTPREQDILKMLYGFDPYVKASTLEEVGNKYFINGERVRQIEAKILRKLRYPNRASLIRGEYNLDQYKQKEVEREKIRNLDRKKSGLIFL